MQTPRELARDYTKDRSDIMWNFVALASENTWLEELDIEAANEGLRWDVHLPTNRGFSADHPSCLRDIIETKELSPGHNDIVFLTNKWSLGHQEVVPSTNKLSPRYQTSCLRSFH